MTRQIFAAEINFEDAPHYVREKFQGTENNIKQILTRLKTVFDEVFALSTDDKFTLYIVQENIVPLTNFFHLEHQLKGYVQYYYNTEESVTHLFAVASGLLSPIKGDARILAAINQSHQWAAACGTLGITLDSLLQKAIATGRAVRTATGIDKFCGSVVDTGFELLCNKFSNLHEKNFLIVGTSQMACLALEYLAKEGIRNVVITGYHYERAVQLATQFNIKVAKLNKAVDFILDADVIIGASHQEFSMECPPAVKKQGVLDGHPKRFILDFGNPRNFDTEFGDACDADVYTMDDLSRLHPSPLESFGGLEFGWGMVMKRSKEFVDVCKQLNYSPVLRAYLTRVFYLSKNALKTNPKRSLKDILLLKKAIKPAEIETPEDYNNARTHVNNYHPENASEIVKCVKGFKKFRFYISDN